MAEEPKEEGEGNADKKAGHDGEVERGVLAAMDDVARQAAKAEGQPSGEVKECADKDDEAAQEKESAAEFADRPHKNSLEEHAR